MHRKHLVLVGRYIGFRTALFKPDQFADRYATEGSYPFYILRQTVIVIFGYFVVQGRESIAMKCLLIAAASPIATILIYNLAVRCTNLPCFLFVMKPLPSSRVPSPRERAAPRD